MSSAPCDYDCYQINLPVTLNEEDSCLYSRYGLSVFNIRKAGDSKKCKPCTSSPYDPNVSQNVDDRSTLTLGASIPDAVIISVDVDRCDCTKAMFCLYVKLPCNGPNMFAIDICKVSKLREEIESLFNSVLGDDQNSVIPVDVQNARNNFNNLVSTLETALAEKDCTRLSVAVNDVRTAITTLKNALLADGVFVIDNSTKQNIVNLLDQIDALLAPFTVAGEGYDSVKLSLYSTATGCDRELLTFLVNPLPSNVVSTGVVEKCYSYEITRVPCRVLNTEETCDGEFALCEDGVTKVELQPSECCRICADQKKTLEPTVMRVTFPLTKELKCLVPDFGLPGTVVNRLAGTVYTLVRIVSTCPVKFAIPAKLYFDNKKCTVCLEVSVDHLKEAFPQQGGCGNPTKSSGLRGYEHLFGSLGCVREGAYDYTTSNCSQRAFCEQDHNGSSAIYAALYEGGSPLEGLFDILSFSKKLDVVGVHKCVEKVFFSFQVCTVPYKGFCVDICGRCKVRTLIPDRDDRNRSSYKVQADGCYTYEFLVPEEEEEPSTTVCC